ncbi:MAG TPA: ribose-5-phosphate isomerase RpiA [Candidatus Binataceae bacterium]|nr:ribose-5-phosphate isomerase RpiA [Candidatus Binataceae bacterium]
MASDSITPPEAPSSSRPLDVLARAALGYVNPGETIGLGSGRAAHAFIRALAQVRLDVRGVPTSSASAELARSLRIPLVNLDDVDLLDADFDGADEVDPHLDMIKGRGGAMVREKVVAAAARRRIFLVGDEKIVKRLGEHGNLPLEVVPFAKPLVLRQIANFGLSAKVRLDSQGHQLISDNGNLVVDCHIGTIADPSRLESDLRSIPGLVGTGLFLGLADIVLVVSKDGKIRTLRRSQ